MPRRPPDHPQNAAPNAPLDLPRLLMRRAAVVALLVLAAALPLAVLRMNQDIGDEVDAAMGLASLVARLGQLAQAADEPALQALRTLQADRPLRHLALQVRDVQGRLLLGPADEPPAAWPLRPLLALHRSLSPADARAVAWTVPRPEGGAWTLSLTASHEAERREAMTNVLGTLALLAAATLGLLLAMRWNMRRAFAPLDRLLAAIGGIERQDTRAVQALPPMPITELEVVAAAMRHLAGALDAADARRRLLSQQVLTLQDDERARLARELHDEFGQRLTALRVDAAWLARRTEDQPTLHAVVQGMAGQCQQIQQDIRALLTRLQPFGSAGSGADGEAGQSLARLLALLEALLAGWRSAPHGEGLRCTLQRQWLAADGTALPWPEATLAERLCLPQPLALTLYRISQESLTNVARHAHATQATLVLTLQGPPSPGAALQIDWQVQDDGQGLPDPEAALARGNGLAGLRERVWAQGADLELGPAQPGAAMAPGLRLAAQFATHWLPAAPADA